MQEATARTATILAFSVARFSCAACNLLLH